MSKRTDKLAEESAEASKVEETTTVNDTELDTLEAQLVECKGKLENPQIPAVGADGSEVKAIDPATIMVIINVVLDLLKRWRNR